MNAITFLTETLNHNAKKRKIGNEMRNGWDKRSVKGRRFCIESVKLVYRYNENFSMFALVVL